MAVKIKTLADLQKALEARISVAVSETCQYFQAMLRLYIYSEYYVEYAPQFYNRTNQFLMSATARMIKSMEGQIYVDESAMNYTGLWNGDIQAEWAAEGYHGSFDIQTPGRYWEKFIDDFKQNAPIILKENLRKQGINVK